MRLAVVADIHGNLPALEAVLADQAGRHVDRVVNLGDCVSGPLWPRETLALLQSRGWPTVRGNHDRVVGGAADGSSLGASDRFAFEALSAVDRAWLADLPPRLGGEHWFENDHHNEAAAQPDGPATGARPPPMPVAAMHACPEDDEAYLLEDQRGRRLVRADPATIRVRLGAVMAGLVLTAHSHRQRSLQLPNGPTTVNPGSVGCPAYDDDATDPPHISEQGSPAARYAIIEPRAEGLLIELLSIPYDHRSAASRARGNDRPDWAHALTTGFMGAAGERA